MRILITIDHAFSIISLHAYPLHAGVNFIRFCRFIRWFSKHQTINAISTKLKQDTHHVSSNTP